MANQLSIFDKDGNLLWEGTVNSPVFGLQGGETFWFGTPDKRTWGKIVSISYGLKTDDQSFLVEIVVDLTERKPTKVVQTKRKLIDHGEKGVKSRYGGAISIRDGDILITVGNVPPGATSVDRLTLQVNSPTGLLTQTAEDVEVGSSIKVQDEFRVVTATLVHAYYDHSPSAVVRVTEHVPEDE